MTVNLTQSDWAVVDEPEINPGETIAATNIIAGFAPDNVGIQNAKSLQFDLDEVSPDGGGEKGVAYKLITPNVSLIGSTRSFRGWMRLNLDSLRAQVAFNLDFVTFSGVICFFQRFSPTSLGVVIISLSSGAPEASPTVAFHTIDTTLPFYVDCRLEPSGADLDIQVDLYDSSSAYVGTSSTTISSSVNTNKVGTDGVFAIVGGQDVGAAAGGLVGFDDIEWSNLTPTPPPTITLPLLVNFEVVSWA